MNASDIARLGYTDLVSVIPPGARLSAGSKVAPESRGKAPGVLYPSGCWGGYAWQTSTCSPESILKSGANTGLKADNYPAIDVDIRDEELVGVISGWIEGHLFTGPIRVGLPPKRLYPFRLSGAPFARMRLSFSVGDTKHLIEILAAGQQYLLAGTHPSGCAYTWPKELIPANQLPTLSEAEAKELLEYLAFRLDLLGHEVDISFSRSNDSGNVQQERLKGPLGLLKAALTKLPNTPETHPSREDYISVGYAVRGASQDDPEGGYDAFLEWALKYPGVNGRANTPESVRADWERMHPPFQLGIDWIVDAARTYGFDSSAYEFPTELPPAVKVDETGGILASEVPYSDVWVADTMVDTHGSRVRFVPEWGKWLGWDGVTWRDDLDAAVPGLIRGVCVTAANKVARMGLTPAEQAKFLSIAKGLSSQRQIQACEVLCRNDRRLRISSQKLNTHRDLLGTPAGIVDLPSGVMLPADPQLYMTRQTAVVPRMEDCPTWIRFLKDVAQGDMDYVAYLQRLAGYFLTGRTDEHSLWYMWGPGGNGKSTFLGVLEHLMGQYARTASMDVFVASEFSRHPTELAALAGSRMVMASEIREGQTWDEGRIKSLTGGDRVTARFLYQDEFEYVPEFKLALVGNAKPKLARVDDAVKRRFHLLPFIFKPAVPNTSLMDTLRAESPAILWWAIRGAKDWYSGGLRPPKVVLAASEEYMERNDPIGRFVRECTSDSARVEVQALYEAWSRWCDANGESAGSMKRFSQALEDRGFKRFRSSATGRMGFVGLAATASEFAGSAIQ